MATVSFQLPESIEKQLRKRLGNLDLAAKEAAWVELFRLGKLAHAELATALGLERFAADAILEASQVFRRSTYRGGTFRG